MSGGRPGPGEPGAAFMCFRGGGGAAGAGFVGTGAPSHCCQISQAPPPGLILLVKQLVPKRRAGAGGTQGPCSSARCSRAVFPSEAAAARAWSLHPRGSPLRARLVKTPAHLHSPRWESRGVTRAIRKLSEPHGRRGPSECPDTRGLRTHLPLAVSLWEGGMKGGPRCKSAARPPGQRCAPAPPLPPPRLCRRNLSPGGFPY